MTVDVLNGTVTDSASDNVISKFTHTGSRLWMVLLSGANVITNTAGQPRSPGTMSMCDLQPPIGHLLSPQKTGRWPSWPNLALLQQHQLSRTRWRSPAAGTCPPVRPPSTPGPVPRWATRRPSRGSCTIEPGTANFEMVLIVCGRGHGGLAVDHPDRHRPRRGRHHRQDAHRRAWSSRTPCPRWT